jgi:molecular chaperone GrpE
MMSNNGANGAPLNNAPEPQNAAEQTAAAAPANVNTETDIAAAADPAADAAATLARAEALAAENWNKYLRISAELDNVRKRAARDVEKARLFGVEGLAAALLNVADSLEMALETGSQAPAETLLEGGRATLKQLQAALEKFGVTVIFPEGEPFNPELHEAISMQDSATAEPNSVLIVAQRGYQLNGRLLRPARVVVAREPLKQG